jgi:hypothetical protein
MASGRRWVAGLGLAVSLVAGQASAWQEVHQSGDDVHVRVDTHGVAVVEHAIAYRVVRGPLRAFELYGIEPNAVIEPTVTVTSEDGRELAAQASTRADRSLRVVVREPRALMRGTFVFRVRYSVDLVEAQELARDGAMWRLTWAAPVAHEGFDGARTTFVLPSSPTEPRPIRFDTGAVDDAAIQTLRRGNDHDELELVRPHVSRGEGVTWTVRLDPKAFPDVRDPRLRGPAAPARTPPDRVAQGLSVAAVLLVGVLFALLIAAKARWLAALCAGRNATPRPLVKLAPRARVLLAGVALSSAVALQIAGAYVAGALGVVAAMLLAAMRRPEAKPVPRGPGKWVPIRAEEAFPRRARRDAASIFELSSGRGQVAAFGAVLLVSALAVAVRLLGPEWPYLVVLDAFALVPLFATGRLAQLPPDAARAPVRFLRQVLSELQRVGDALRTVPWARFPIGQDTPDELRLLSLPRPAMPGVLGVEVGVAWRATTAGYTPSPEVLVRVLDASAAAARMVSLARGAARPVPGRRPDERVYRMLPEEGTVSAVVSLVGKLARELVDRRAEAPATAGAWDGVERRGVKPAPAEGNGDAAARV